MIFKIFSAKNGVFCSKYCKISIKTLVFMKNVKFSPKIAENGDHNIDPIAHLIIFPQILLSCRKKNIAMQMKEELY
jgi:hypothetical protein